MLEKNNDKQIFWENPSELKKLIKSLKNNEISIVSTDTIYGFLGNLTKYSFNKLNSLKEDRKQKPYLILIEAEEKLEEFVNIKNLSPAILKIIKKCWPGAITLIFKAKESLPSHLITAKEETVALRCPDHAPLRKILKSFNGLLSTSANKAGKEIPKNLQEINPSLLKKVKFFVDYKKPQKETCNIPSTILDCSNPNKIKVVRSGIYPIKKLEELYGSKFEK